MRVRYAAAEFLARPSLANCLWRLLDLSPATESSIDPKQRDPIRRLGQAPQKRAQAEPEILQQIAGVGIRERECLFGDYGEDEFGLRWPVAVDRGLGNARSAGYVGDDNALHAAIYEQLPAGGEHRRTGPGHEPVFDGLRGHLFARIHDR